MLQREASSLYFQIDICRENAVGSDAITIVSVYSNGNNALFMTIITFVSSRKPSTGMKSNVLCVHDRYDRIYKMWGEVPTSCDF